MRSEVLLTGGCSLTKASGVPLEANDLAPASAGGRLRDARGGSGALRRRRPGHHVVEPIALVLEAGEQRAFEHPAARQPDAHRIDEAAVDQYLVVQVGAGRKAG